MTLNQARNKIASLISTQNNAMSLPREYFKYGNGGGPIRGNWKQVVMDDKDLYKGYPYAAINARANIVARTATQNIRTEFKAKDDSEEYTHPYLDIINSSPTFSNYEFWRNISIYLDLEGWFFLFALRAREGDRYGNVQEFKLLNPYNIRRIVDKDTGEVGGYVEMKNGKTREIPPHMIIEIKELNPFDNDEAYAMTDAAKDSQFTMVTAGDYTRNALTGNINAPGIISTDVILSREEFENFKARVRDHVAGEPIFGNGQGAINYESMTTELSKAALKDVNEIGRDELLAISGVSKTIIGIEQSGTTRETSRVQKELNMELHILPRIQLIIDSLNQDRKNNYPNEHKKKEEFIAIDNPMESDQDTNIKEMEAKKSRFELYDQLVGAGYDEDLAQRYVKGEVDVDKLGEPANEPRQVETEESSNIVVNQLSSEGSKGIIQQQQGALKNAVENAEARIVATALNKIQKKAKNAISTPLEDDFTEEKDIITKRDKNDIIKELSLILGSFYGIVLSLEGQKVSRKRSDQFNMPSSFDLNSEVVSYIKKTSQKVSAGHVDTVLDDILVSARESALAGDTFEELTAKVRKEYNGKITKVRAQTVARTETNRAFTRAQYEADRQFIDDNDLSGRVYKQWRTRSDNPCPYCESLEREGLVPFDNAFRNLGDTITVDGKTLDVNFESLEAGNAHPNCSCTYELIIRPERSDANKERREDLDNKEREINEVVEGLKEIL